MRFVLRVLVTVTTCLTVALPAAAGPAHNAVADAAYVHRLLYRTTLDQFMRTASSGDPWFDWSSDWCSAPLVGNTGRSFDFRAPCRRHDFGYRNLRLLERRYGSGSTYWNKASRLAVDRQFLSDMNGHCWTRLIFLKPTCLAWARTYYTAVRVVGGP